MLISIPLYIFLFIYLSFLVLFTIFFIFNLMHLMHTGGSTMVSLFSTVAMFAASAFIIFYTYAAVQGTDWKQTISLNFADNITENY